jgi:hypothetical protein
LNSRRRTDVAPEQQLVGERKLEQKKKKKRGGKQQETTEGIEKDAQ